VCGYRAQSDGRDHVTPPRRDRKEPALPARFYSIAMMVLGALVVGLVVLLLLRA
jgi:hypothetical protein